MITKFDSLYAGHIDMDNIGYAGTPVNDREFGNAPDECPKVDRGWMYCVSWA